MTAQPTIVRFTVLRAAAYTQLQEIDQQVSRRLTEQGVTGGAREFGEETLRNELLQDCEWSNENFEGRGGVPTLPFVQIQALVAELEPVFEQKTPLTVSQNVALQFACLVADIQ